MRRPIVRSLYRKWPWATLAILALGVAASVSPWRISPPEEKIISEKKDRLLKQTDLGALRDACRWLIKSGQGKPHGRAFDVGRSDTPPVLRRLEPSQVTVGETFARVELGGPGLYYGFEVFIDRFNQVPFPTAEEVADGIWYYETNAPIERAPR